MKKDILVELVVFQVEGISTVYDKLDRLNIQALTVTPFYFVETGDSADLRLPPLDVDGQSRELERPLWGGETVKYGKKYLLFDQNEDYYGSSPYRTASKVMEKDFCAEVVQEGKKRGYEVNLCLPGNPPLDIEDRDKPVDVFGNPVSLRISGKGCINNPRIRDTYIGAAIDLAEQYKPAGILVDWIEYTNYFFSDNLVCFCDHCRESAQKEGVNFEALRQSAESVYEWIESADAIPNLDGANWSSLWELMGPGISNLFKFKAQSCSRLIQQLRSALDDHEAKDTKLIFPGFAPPMNIGTGFHYNSLCNSAENIQIQPKGYRFHWGMMVKWYAEEFASLNKRNLDARSWVPFVVKLLEVSESAERDIEEYTMPNPDEEGPISPEIEFEKLSAGYSSVDDTDKLSFRLHGYGPDRLFQKRVEYADSGPYSEVHIQRYGYTGDRKLDMLEKL